MWCSLASLTMCSHAKSSIAAGSTRLTSLSSSNLSPDSLLQAATFVQTIQSRTGMLVGCPEEVAFRMGYITADQLREQAQRLGKTELGSVLLDLADGEHE